MSNTIIKKIWERIKTIVVHSFYGLLRTVMSKLSELIPRRFIRKAKPEPAPHVDKALERRLARRIQQRAVRPIDTREGGPNMPRYQFCPRGHGSKKRTRKTMDGAYYGCNRCGEFFVGAPEL